MVQMRTKKFAFEIYGPLEIRNSCGGNKKRVDVYVIFAHEQLCKKTERK